MERASYRVAPGNGDGAMAFFLFVRYGVAITFYYRTNERLLFSRFIDVFFFFFYFSFLIFVRHYKHEMKAPFTTVPGARPNHEVYG